MNKVIESSPWMVNGKPLLVQKWDPALTIEKVDPVKVPIWVKFKEITLEAWNVKGLSDIASRVGKPISMDTLTANMCHKGSGRAGFARIMVEVENKKGLIEQVEIQYKDKEQKLKGIKKWWWTKNGGLQFVNTTLTGDKIYCSFVCACNKGKDRVVIWKDLQMQKSITHKKPWFIMEDFNVTRYLNEHSSGSSMMTEDMKEFNACINDIEVEDINSFGFHFTWTKSLKNPRCGTLKKLDRIMINDEVMNSIPQAHGVFLPYIISDHSPAILCIPNFMVCKPKSFRFMNFIADKEAFLPMVEKGRSTQHVGCAMFCLLMKLKGLKKDLKKLTWVDGDIFKKVKELKEKLKVMQSKIDDDPHNVIFRGQATQILNDYETAKKQKARVESICNENGVRFYGDEVADQFVRHFQNFLGRTDSVKPIDELGDIFSITVETSEADAMIIEVSNAEIKNAIFDIDGDKAADPDGYSSQFFKKAWNIVGDDVCKAIKEFFHTGELIGGINSTLISLIPKLDTPNKVSDFRSIACCNVLYKCISKILVNRMKQGLKKLVNINQSAFMPGRAIKDNILVTQKLLKGYNRIHGFKRCALKIDLQKAYDTVSWVFLKAILVKFGFHSKMIGWIMKCVSTTKFFIWINDEIKGYFKGGRGLRQADPISPYLFTLVMEVLNLILAHRIKDNVPFKYHVGCKEMKLTHVCFADDLFVFCHADICSVKIIKQALNEFSDVSVGKLPVKYLGVPLLAKRVGVIDCKEIIEKIKNRIDNWRTKHLSYAGMLQLIASVLSSMHIYWASVYKIPNTVIIEIEKIIKGFLWNHGDSIRGKAKVSWKVVCTLKNQGGLGLKPMQEWNNESLWYNWVNLVKLKGKSIWEIEDKQSDSWGWKQLLLLRDKVRNHVAEDIDGSVKWITNKGNKVPYKTSQAWVDLTASTITVPWHHVVWFPQANPKHAFIMWLAVKERLTTHDKLMKWYPSKSFKCALCDKEEDYISHLFFGCEFSKKKYQIWDVINRLTVAAAMYHIWQERNCRIFKGNQRSEVDLTQCIVDGIRLKLTTLKVRGTAAIALAAKNWKMELIDDRLKIQDE
ncbi:uncharacterized protein [Rutidosis leptorrhynchoides]|uniref:uncharacterized protein n=1 Tax=Rutidosis leptorrhynchoides TaxID=125765 RepID=UPI003A996DAA